MKSFASLVASAAVLPIAVQALVPIYYQCAGEGYTGETECDAGLVCVYSNPWYSQCLPPGPNQTTVPPSGGGTTTTKTSTTKTSTTTTKPNTTTTKTTTSTTKTTTSTGSTGTPVPPGGIVGYATLNGGTTGGAGGPTIVVSSLTELRNAVKGTSPKIVRINTMITGDEDEVDIGSNTSILGGCGGGLTNGGFRIKDGKNVIIRNLKLHHSKAPVDMISVYTSSNVWIDHNELWSNKGSNKDEYDGAIDITHAGDYVTISWNYIHDHWKTSLVGHSDSNSSEDKGKFHVSYHHNYYKNVGSRLPSLRFGTGHVWNNLADTVSESGVNSRLGAQMLVENNVFINVNNPLLTKEYGGYAVERGNDWGGATPELSPGSLNSAPYAYSLESTSSVSASVIAGAGACKITV